MKTQIAVVFTLLLGACAGHEQTTSRPPMVQRVAGDQNAIAVCAYRRLEPEHKDGLRIFELRSDNSTVVERELRGYSLLYFHLVFAQEAPKMTRVEIRGLPNVRGNQYNEREILSVIQPCLLS